MGWTPDSSAVLTLASDPALEKLGCEAQPEWVLFATPIAGGPKRPTSPTDPLRNGAILRRGGVTVQVDYCEGFLAELSIIDQTPDGLVSNPRLVSVSEVGVSLGSQAPVFSLSLDGKSLYTTFTEEEGSNTIAQLDLATGVFKQILPEIDGGRSIEDATDGRIVVSDGTIVRIIDAAGTVTQSYAASAFDVSDDGTRIALLRGQQVWVTDVGKPIGEAATVSSPTGEVVALSPDNNTVLVYQIDYGYSDETQEAIGWLEVVRGTTNQMYFANSYVHAAGWSPNGKSFALSVGQKDVFDELVTVTDVT
jgi:WD40 repeat protein